MLVEYSQQISIFITHNSFSVDTQEYLLLKVLRCYIEIDLYASFEVHTDQTIMAGREKVAQFYKLMEVSLVNLPA